MAGETGSKTEKPTPERLKKARAEGQFFASPPLVAAIQFLAFVAIAGQVITSCRASLSVSLQQLMDRAVSGPISASEWPLLARNAISQAFVPVLRIVVVPLLLGIGLHFVLTRMGFSTKRLIPAFDRIDPISRLKSMPGRNLKSLVQACALIVVLSWVLYQYVLTNMPDLLMLPFESPLKGAGQVGESVHSLLWKAAFVFLVFGFVDALQQYRTYTSRLKMTKEEVKEETKRAQGDPHIKARIKRLRRDLLRRRMMSEVPQATAVIVNPTHFAVAIRYDESMACPVVTAKGRNWLALRIRQVAMENQVPIIENPPLARALYEMIDVGRAISPEFYKAVAEILAYVYRMMGIKMPR
jgi:flagellar biosynthesis protein FlhB